jgi:hypothetical protein
MARKLLIGLAIVVVVLIGLVLIVASRIDSETLGRELLARASTATGVALDAKSFEISLFKGLDLSGVTAEGDYSQGHYRINVDKLSLRYRLRPLLQGTVSVSEILLDGPDVEFTVTPSKIEAVKAPPGPPDGGSMTDLTLEVTEIKLTRGHILVRKVDGEGKALSTTEIKDLAVMLRNIVFNPAAPSPVERVSGQGVVSAQQVLLNSLALNQVNGNLALDQGVAEIRDLSTSTEYGDLSSNVTLDLKPVPFEFSFDARGDPINVNQIVGLGPDGTLGNGQFEIQGKGTGNDPEEMDANGKLQLSPGKIPNHPVLAKASQILGIKNLVGAPYQASPATFRLQDKRVTLEGLELKSELAAVGVSGWAQLAGPISMVVTLQIPRQGLVIPRVPPVALDALTDSNGWIRIPFNVTGTREKPDVTLDLDYLLRQGAAGAGLRLLERLRGN